MKRYKKFIRRAFQNRIEDEFDFVLLVIGDEGVGKSTLILQTGMIYQDIRHGERYPDALLDNLVYNRQDMADAFATSDRRDMIAVPDAARALHKMEFMVGEQRELEKDFLDVRTQEYFIIMGYQDWSDVPSFLQERRSHAAIHIYERGKLHGYSREQLDEKLDLEDNEWPDETLTGSFPSLEGTDLWEHYKALDREKKQDRMGDNGDEPSAADAIREYATEVAIRAHRPWDDNRGLTYREIAHFLPDYSDSWVGKRVREWKDGEHRDKVDKEMAVTTRQQ